MSLYPSLSNIPFVTIGQSIEQRILKSNFEELGKIQVKRKWLYPRRSISLNYNNISNENIRTIEQFFMDRSGTYLSFTFIMPPTETESYENEYVGTGDGSNKVFNMPCVSTSRSLYIGGSIQSEAADATSAGSYYIIDGGGQDGVDSCIFFTEPSIGERITCDFVGRLGLRCRFAESLSYERFRHIISLNSLSVSLNGLLIDE